MTLEEGFGSWFVTRFDSKKRCGFCCGASSDTFILAVIGVLVARTKIS